MKKARFISSIPLALLLSLYGVSLSIYAVFSFSQTDPNLVLLNWSPYWQFQLWMWETFFKNPVLTAWSYGVLLSVLFSLYLLIIQKLERSSIEYEVGWKKGILIYGLLLSPLLLSYNALSHDVFNYIFNAKMVVQYHANPHIQVALDFSNDPWTRFMHNTHTPAPYWYGWTAISLIPYLMGLGKFILTWISFRIWSLISIVLLYFVMQYAAQIFTGHKLQTYQLASVFLNPLFMIEIISNMHNDLWMVGPAALALAVVTSLDPQHIPQAKKLSLSIVLLLASISIKLATAVLIPLLISIVVEKNFLFSIADMLAVKLPFFKILPAKLLHSLESYIYRYIPIVAAGLLFLPLLTTRSQQFHPWYWTWVLVWLPFIESKLMRNCIIIFSISSMLRYLPWLWTGGFEGDVLLYQKMITWVPVVLYLVWKFFPWSIVQGHQDNSESLLRR